MRGGFRPPLMPGACYDSGAPAYPTHPFLGRPSPVPGLSGQPSLSRQSPHTPTLTQVGFPPQTSTHEALHPHPNPSPPPAGPLASGPAGERRPPLDPGKGQRLVPEDRLVDRQQLSSRDGDQ